MSKLVLVLAVIALASGCAFSNVTITPPRGPVSSGVRGGKGRVVVIEVPFSDERPMRNRCGMQKNGWNMDTANVNCSVEPYVHLADLLANELKEAGFSVSFKSKESSDPLQIKGKLLKFFVEPKVGFFTFTPEADIHIRLIATSNSGLIAERDFYVKADETSFVGVEGNFQLASEAATRKIITDMVSAIVSLSDRYPEIGQPTQKTSQSSTTSFNGDRS